MSEHGISGKQAVTLASVVYHDPEMVTAPMDDELVMFSLQRGMYYGLDNIASRIWELIDQPVQVSDLCARLLDEYDVDRETCQHDTIEILNWLYQQELLKIDSKSN